MKNHELRQRSVAEMHLRRWPSLPVPCLIVQWVVIVDPADRAEELAQIERHADRHDTIGNPSHREGALRPGIHFAWEKHSEGSSLTLFAERGDGALFLDPAADPELAEALAWAESLPGDIVRSTRIWLAANDAEAEQLLRAAPVSADELVSCHVGGAIRMWSDFRLNPDGYGRLLVAANGAGSRDLTRHVQRLQELGNYRNRALLGLPLAQEYWPRLDQAEARLKDLADRLVQSNERDDALMESLSELSLELATISTGMSFRMDATRAYARLVEERLVQLRCEPIAGFMSLDDFTQRRFRPAMNTCEAITTRVERLALRTEQLSSLLRARIEARIENQNAQLLRSMERSISMQVRLQQLVEGLSVVALSYYLIGLIAFFLDGLPPGALGMSHDLVLGLLVVPVLLGVWLVTRTIKNRLLNSTGA
ncbi:DUF3422 domain-containing protein [Leptolyngbya sp. 15MV]|nr:DUF3422 domain-containing protein [Leptolyngbya sp. 15MV]